MRAVLTDSASREPTDVDATSEKQVPHKKHHRLLSLLKGTTKNSVDSMLQTDRWKSAGGEQQTRNRLRMVQPRSNDPAGPLTFPARYKSKRGHVYISSSAVGPVMSWTMEKEDTNPVLELPVADIKVSNRRATS